MAYETKAVARRRKLRDALITAAERTIAAEGLRGLKARELAYKVGCAVGAIYNVFDDLDDLIFAVNALTLEQLERMHQLKTGAMLRVSVLLGALAGRDLASHEREALAEYSRAIGLAFQVVDDVLDATADSATLGKTAGKDAADNKPTYVSILGLAPSKALAEQLRQQAHDALAPFGEQALRLREIADLIVQRKA